MKRMLIVPMALATLALVACGRASDTTSRNAAVASIASETASTSSADAQAKRRTARVQELKSSILAFAKVATERRLADETTVAASRLYMSSLVKELEAAAPARSFESKLEKTVGAWQEVWSDEQNPVPPGFKILRPNVFQVIRADGIGFNIGVRSTPGGVGTALIQLTASADKDAERTNVVFTKTFFKPGDLTTETSLTAFVQGILDGTRTDVKALPETPFPRGPVGAKGSLETVYVDDELRVSRGPNAFSGVVDTFVLVRLNEDNAPAK